MIKKILVKILKLDYLENGDSSENTLRKKVVELVKGYQVYIFM